jgi:hypothetical protein
LVFAELSLEVFAIEESQFSLPITLAVLHFSLVHNPEIFKASEVVGVKHTGDGGRIIIIEDSLSIKFIVDPIALVCDCAVGVGEHSIAMHLILLPFTIIVASLRIVELSSAIPPAVSLEAFILGSDLVLLDHVLIVCEVGVLFLDFWNNGG